MHQGFDSAVRRREDDYLIRVDFKLVGFSAIGATSL
jgi:hypothetical protein